MVVNFMQFDWLEIEVEPCCMCGILWQKIYKCLERSVNAEVRYAQTEAMYGWDPQWDLQLLRKILKIDRYFKAANPWWEQKHACNTLFAFSQLATTLHPP